MPSDGVGSGCQYFCCLLKDDLDEAVGVHQYSLLLLAQLRRHSGVTLMPRTALTGGTRTSFSLDDKGWRSE